MSLPAELTVTVTREDARKGIPGTASHCAIAMALKRTYGVETARFYPHECAWCFHHGWEIPDEANLYSHAYDDLPQDSERVTQVPDDWPEPTFTFRREP